RNRMFHVNHCEARHRSARHREFQFVKKLLTVGHSASQLRPRARTGCGSVVDGIVPGYVRGPKSQNRRLYKIKDSLKAGRWTASRGKASTMTNCLFLRALS